MKLTATFDLGDTVWNVFNSVEALPQKCTICQGAGKMKVVGVDELVNCPNCYGRGVSGSNVQIIKPTIRGPYTIGQVTVMERNQSTRDSYQVRELREETYMMQETGIESGTVYRVKDLYATREEAEAESARRREASIEQAALAGHDVSYA